MFEPTTLLLFAQDSPPAPDETGAVTGTPDGPGGTGAAPAKGPFSGVFTIMIVVLGGMILFSIFGQRKQRKKREAMRRKGVCGTF